MLVNTVKWLHMLCTLGLLGLVFLCLVLVSTQKLRDPMSSVHHELRQLNRAILWLALFALCTGTLLVYPKHFTFHMPWIEAAYLLIFIVGTWVSLLLRFSKQTKKSAWVWRGSYIGLIILLSAIIHDAITKTSLIGELLKIN